MAVLSWPATSSYLCRQACERPLSKVSKPYHCFRAPASRLNQQTVTSTSSSSSSSSSSWSAGELLRAKKRASRCAKTSAVSLSVEMGEVAMAEKPAAPKGKERGGESPTVVEFAIPPESLAGFEADYERVSALWPADLATTTDDAVIERFVSSAHALVRRWLPEQLVARLEGFIHDPAESPAMVIRGLPIDKELPPTEAGAHLKKEGKCVSETWLVGIARIAGQVFTFDFVRGSRPGMGLLVREIYTTQDKEALVSSEGSREPLDFHTDFFPVTPEKFPTVIAFIGIRGAQNQEGNTLLCSNRKLYQSLDPADIQVLRSEKITWEGSTNPFSNFVIEGSESNPRFNLFEENIPNFGGFETVKGSPEARAAYKRVKEMAAALAEGVWLGGGDMLLLNQNKATHGRSPYYPRYDGTDRWLQRTYANSGGFWEAGLTQWPSRTLRLMM